MGFRGSQIIEKYKDPLLALLQFLGLQFLIVSFFFFKPG